MELFYSYYITVLLCFYMFMEIVVVICSMGRATRTFSQMVLPMFDH